MAQSVTVACLNDDDAELAATADALDAAGIDVVQRQAVSTLPDVLAGEGVDAVVTATTIDGGDAFDVVARVRETAPDTPVILFGERPDREREPDDVVIDYLPRSIEDARDRLVSIVSNATFDTYQVAYPVPEDEQARIEALQAYDLEDRDAVDAFDRLTKLITRHFDTDVAFVGLVGEHEERFVACEGANWKTLAREDTICTHTILQEELLVVEDVEKDPRFADNDRLTELGIRSYAGARLSTPEGHAIGALCCIDDEPRSYTAAELADLELFADEAMEQLTFRRRLNEHRTEAAE